MGLEGATANIVFLKMMFALDSTLVCVVLSSFVARFLLGKHFNSWFVLKFNSRLLGIRPSFLSATVVQPLPREIRWKFVKN